MNEPDRIDDEQNPPVYPERPRSSDRSPLDWMLDLIPARLLIGLFLILCGTIPYFSLAVYVVGFIAVVALIMYVFHLAYSAQSAGKDPVELDNEDAGSADSWSEPGDDPWPPYDER